MTNHGDDNPTCTDCGVEITGVPVIPWTGEGPTRAQIEKLKPTVYLCTECAKERGLSFDGMAVGKTGDAPPRADGPDERGATGQADG